MYVAVRIQIHEEEELQRAENITSRKKTSEIGHEDGDMTDLVLIGRERTSHAFKRLKDVLTPGTRGDYESSPLRGRNFDVLKRLVCSQNQHATRPR